MHDFVQENGEIENGEARDECERQPKVPAIEVDDGHAGSNWIDYSNYRAAVTVNLAGSATGLTGIWNIQNVIGGDFGNTLTGNSQSNILIGGSMALWLMNRYGVLDSLERSAQWMRSAPRYTPPPDAE